MSNLLFGYAVLMQNV